MVGLWAACSSPSTGSAPPNGDDNAGGEGASAGTASGGASTGGAIATGGFLPTGGALPTGGTAGGSTGGTGNVPSTGGSGNVGGFPDLPDASFVYDAQVGGQGGLTADGACAATSVTTTLGRQPVDIIFIVDNSGSMSFEAGAVQNNMNAFSQQIISSGINVHVVLLSSYPGTGNGICIAPPLGSGGCPTQDTNLPADPALPQFLHINREVGSRDGLQILLEPGMHAQWGPMIRANSKKHIVIVTDDNSDLGAVDFDAQLRALEPKIAATGYQFNGIFAYSDPILSCLAADPCCAIAAAPGDVYKVLVPGTGGVQGNLCLQDFVPVFNAIATSVVTGAGFQCDIPMPVPDQGVVDPSQVRLKLTWSTNPTGVDLLHQTGVGACDPSMGGWYYDNPSNPTMIHLCAETCNAAQAQAALEPRLDVLLGCLGA